MTLVDKQRFLHEQFHRAWGHCKESPEYDKACWRVLDVVINRICNPSNPHGAVLEGIEFGNAILGLQGAPHAGERRVEPERRDLLMERAERLMDRLTQILDEREKGTLHASQRDKE